MWRPECAADESLDVLAEHGITFMILLPHQAERMRAIDAGRVQDVRPSQQPAKR